MTPVNAEASRLLDAHHPPDPYLSHVCPVTLRCTVCHYPVALTQPMHLAASDVPAVRKWIAAQDRARVTA